MSMISVEKRKMHSVLLGDAPRAEIDGISIESILDLKRAYLAGVVLN